MGNNVFDDIISSDIFREEHFVSEVQARLSELIEDKGISRAELARRLDVTRARVTQIFSDDCKNFTVRLLVRSFLAVGEEPVILSRSEYAKLLSGRSSEDSMSDGKTGAVEGLTEAVIASLLRASIGERPIESDRAKRTTGAKDWAAAGSNIVPFREKSHG